MEILSPEQRPDELRRWVRDVSGLECRGFIVDGSRLTLLSDVLIAPRDVREFSNGQWTSTQSRTTA
jgi:hypothetical protein